MIIKNAFILGIIHFLLICIFVFSVFSSNPLLNIFIFIFLLNISAYFALASNFKKNLNNFILFFFVSFVSIIFCTLLYYFILFFLSKINVGAPPEFIKKCYNFALGFEEAYGNFSGFIKIIFTYLFFILMPSFIVLYLSTISHKKQERSSHKRKRK